MKRKSVIATIAIMAMAILITIAIISGFKTKEEKEETVKHKILIESFRIEDRETLKLDNTILVGNNKKELENDFYDIKILNTEHGVEVLLNKLWYENYDKDYIQEDYLAKICRQMASNLKIENIAEEFEYVLYKYIKENYTKVRQGVSVEEIKTEDFTVEFALQDDIAKLIIRGE